MNPLESEPEPLFKPMQLPKPKMEIPHLSPPTGEERLVGEWTALSQEEIAKHAAEVAELEAQISDLEKRVRKMSLFGKVGAIITGHPETAEYLRLCKKLEGVKNNPRFTKKDQTVH